MTECSVLVSDSVISSSVPVIPESDTVIPAPDAADSASDSVASNPVIPAPAPVIPAPTLVIPAQAGISHDEFPESNVGESIPANVDDEPSKGGIHWIPLSISAVATLAGTVLAIVGNNKAKKDYEEVNENAGSDGYAVSDLEAIKDDAEIGQTMRNIGIGVAIAGAVGIVLSIAL